MRDQLGVAIADDVLPLSCTYGYFTRYWLSPEPALTSLPRTANSMPNGAALNDEMQNVATVAACAEIAQAFRTNGDV